MLVCSFSALFAHEIAGAARIRHSLRPLDFWEARKIIANLGRIVPRERETISTSSRPSAQLRTTPGRQREMTQTPLPRLGVLRSFTEYPFGPWLRPVHHIPVSPNPDSCCFTGISDNMRGHRTAAESAAQRRTRAVHRLDRFYRLFSYSPYAFPLCQNWLRTLRMSDA